MIWMTEFGKVLSTKIRNLNPFCLSDEGVIIKQLLDGSVNVQSVGKIPRKITFEALIEAIEAEYITRAYKKGEKFLIHTLSKEISFIVVENPNFERFNSRYSSGKIVVKITGIEQ